MNIGMGTALPATLLIALDGLPAKATEACLTKHGLATGITRDFAEYESFLIIRQVTGNWPFQTDKISEPTYVCKDDGPFWTCRATAKVCKG